MKVRYRYNDVAPSELRGKQHTIENVLYVTGVDNTILITWEPPTTKTGELPTHEVLALNTEHLEMYQVKP